MIKAVAAMRFIGFLKPVCEESEENERMSSEENGTTQGWNVVCQNLFNNIGILGADSDGFYVAVVLFVNG